MEEAENEEEEPIKPVDPAMEKWLKNIDDGRISINGKFIFLIIVEMMLVWFLGREQFVNKEFAAAYAEMPESSIITICRFLCAIFLHISLADELEQANMLMKYAMNHPYRFKAWFNAFLVGLAQLVALVSVELVNVAVLLTNPTVMDTIMNFLALVIISDFDDYFFSTIKNDPIARLISDGEIVFF